MARKTRKQSTKKRHLQGIKTIPELRQSFDYIDEFVKQRVQSGVSKDQLAKEIQTEWRRVFGKRIQKKNATAFAEHIMQQVKGRRGLRAMTRKRGGGSALSGAPFMDPTLQQGAYLASGTPPTADGHYPMAMGGPSVYGNLTQYVSSGFSNPEKSIPQSPPGFYPHPSASMGSNQALRGGGRALRSKKRGGSLMGSVLSQAFARPIPSNIPSNVLQDAQTAWHGGPSSSSSNQPQNQPNYALRDSMFPKMVNVRIDV